MLISLSRRALVRARRLGQRAQASIFMGIMSLTFMGLFIFVINTGLLVSAKINLQNAADLAAYAGAAVQARTLNKIAFLNYEMRRQYKKFLFRYYVLGNMNQKSHSADISGASGSPTRTWKPSGNGPGYGVPTICMAFGSDNNICQVDSLKPLTKIQANPLDAIGSTLKAQFETLEQFRQLNCQQLTVINEMAAKLWLYNTDPEVETLRGQLQSAATDLLSQNTSKAINALQGYSTGLGLVPRMTLLAKRIKTLEEYLNAPANRSVDGALLTQLQSFPDVSYRERTIQAYLSAFNTLGGPGPGEGGQAESSGHIFVDGSLTMDELLPSGGDGALLARLRPIRTEMDVFYATLDPVAAQGGACVGQPTQIKVPNLTVGFEKDPTILTYYALRLQASYRPLFFPKTPIPMRAYAAARPFGSRIGPPASVLAGGGAAPFTGKRTVNSPLGAQPTGGLSNDANIPNLPITRGESPGGSGWESSPWIGAVYGALVENSPGANPVIGPQDVERAFQVSMVPNPAERGLYTIPNDSSEDPFEQFMDESGLHPIWAPLRSPSGATGQGADPAEEIRQAVSQSVGGGARAEAFASAIGTYFSKLGNPKGGEAGEDIRTVALKDPIRFVGIPGDGQIRLGDEFFMRNPRDLKTSWADLKNLPYKIKGRVGYSIKFVSFRSLTNPSETVDGSTGFSNTLQESDAEVQSLRH